MNATADSGKQENKPAASASTGSTTAAGNTAVPHQGDHDRVQLLSLRADGTPDQHNPEMIDASDFTREATREQFRQQAVSAHDVQIRGASSVPMMTVYDDNGNPREVPASEAPQDPSIQEMQDQHQSLAESATKAADSAVDALASDDAKAAAEDSSNTGGGAASADARNSDKA